jgi:hypothetical protein
MGRRNAIEIEPCPQRVDGEHRCRTRWETTLAEPATARPFNRKG